MITHYYEAVFGIIRVWHYYEVCVCHAPALWESVPAVYTRPSHPKGRADSYRPKRQRSSGWRRHPGVVFKNTVNAGRVVPPSRGGGTPEGSGVVVCGCGCVCVLCVLFQHSLWYHGIICSPCRSVELIPILMSPFFIFCLHRLHTVKFVVR